MAQQARVLHGKLARLNELDDRHLACRAGRHSWPVLIPGRKLPKGISATRQADGCYQVTETCAVCDEERTKTTLPNGVYDQSATYKYRYPERWIRFSIDEEISRSDIVGELYRRIGEELFR